MPAKFPEYFRNPVKNHVLHGKHAVDLVAAAGCTDARAGLRDIYREQSGEGRVGAECGGVSWSSVGVERSLDAAR